ncbi:hypothetical protein RND81_01G080900 [Saponaria officinalis]|uniref:RING-type E3 ubiquitin transferase n=1 Tax=Saponaria officinalis TaxID=3572 RepID=A0AAW1NDW2_SAPOF
MSSFDVLVTFVDRVVKCRRFVSAKGCGGDMARREMTVSVGAVVALPSVEVKSGGECVECTICRVELGKERDVCELPCQHLFHWMCVLPWFSKRNTCPCCRFRLPTNDVYGELERVWDAVVKIGRQIFHPLENQIVG